MEIFDIVKYLCEDRNVKISALERDLNFSRGSIYKMADSAPSSDKLKKLADYFDVTTDYLVGRTSVKNFSANIGSETNISYETLLKLYEKCKSNLTPEQKISLAQTILSDRTN